MKLPQDPIFIVGYPRSGTTLLQRLLAAQPGLYTFPETHYFCVIDKKINWGEDKESIAPASLAAVFDNIEKKMEFRPTDAEEMVLYRQATDKKLSSQALFEYIISHFLANSYPEIIDGTHFRWIEKTPNHAHFLDRIIAFYPRAQVLHVLRHPVPAIYSRKLKFPFNQGTPVEELARRWNRMLLDVERFQKDHADRIISLRYEDLVRDMEKKLGEVGDFLNFVFDFNILAGMKQTNEPQADAFILKSETWKREDLRLDLRTTNEKYHEFIPAADVDAIEAIVMEPMRRHGYEPFSARAE